MSSFDYIQTFYVDPAAVDNASDIMLTSVDLFFKSKPGIGTGANGAGKPGVNIWICEVTNNEPVPGTVLAHSATPVLYDNINISSDAQTPTAIGFKDPVILKSGNYYGIVVKFNDPGFALWVNTQGDNLIGPSGLTNKPSPGSQSRFDGYLYHAADSSTVDKLSNSDLKFSVKIADFHNDNITITLVNKAYEFFTIDRTYIKAFKGGEWVYQLPSVAPSGTISCNIGSATITGSGTTFTSLSRGDRIVITNGTLTDVLQINAVINSTTVEVDRFPSFTASGINYYVPVMGQVKFTDYTKNKVYLIDSTANSTVKFVAGGNRIFGVESGASANIVSIDSYQVDSFRPTFMLGNPSTSTTSFNYSISDDTKTITSPDTPLNLLEFNATNKKSFIHSRSLEVAAAGLYGSKRKSGRIDVGITHNNTGAAHTFAVPYMKSSELDMYIYQNDINDVYTETRNGITEYDTEIDRNGLAKSKYISKKISFAEGKNAEDLVVYLAGYRPPNTEIRVYAKLHNTSDKEAFDDKAWSPLIIKNNAQKYSSVSDLNDMYEYTYALPQYPEKYLSLSGKFTTDGTTTIATTVNQTSYLSAGDLIRISDPLFEADNHEVFVVESVATNQIVTTRAVTNVDIIGDMNVDKLKYKDVAWNNIANANNARYVTSTGVEFDTYNTIQLKIVLLANSNYTVPKVEQIQVIGVSA